MDITHFLSLADIVLLEIFAYLSCEDALYAFADLHDFRLVDLLSERGAYWHIRLSSQLSMQQYSVLSKDIWRYDYVRSLVCREMFSDFFPYFTLCRLFPSLTELRLLLVRYSSKIVTEFVIAHAPTLTHFTLTPSKEAFLKEEYQEILHAVLPHLNQLKVLDTSCRSEVQVKYF
jgi:hypothetical protein